MPERELRACRAIAQLNDDECSELIGLALCWQRARARRPLTKPRRWWLIMPRMDEPIVIGG